MKNKGGCKIGRKEEPKGGCKVGKRNPTMIEKKVAKEAATKGSIDRRKKKKLINEKKSVVEKKAPKMPAKKRLIITKRLPRISESVNKSKAEKKARIVDKVRKIGKTQIAKKQKTKKDFAAPMRTELQDSFGLSNAEANKMDPTKLFGMLPPEIGRMILTPSLRGGGVQVAPSATTPAKIKAFVDEVRADHSREGKQNIMRSKWGAVADARTNTRSGYLGDAAEKHKEKVEKATKRKLGTLYRKTVGRPMKLSKGLSVNKLTMASLVNILLNSAKVSIPAVKEIYNDYRYEMLRYDF